MACNASPALLVVCGMAFEARMAQVSGVQVVYGLESVKLEADIERAIECGVSGIISFGTAAGLDPALSPGTIIVARTIRSAQQAFTADSAWAKQLRAQLPDAIYGDIAGVDHAIATVQKKTALRAESGAAIVDMESHRAARLAERHSLPFAALRVVLDSADCALPPSALAAIRANGTINYGAMLMSLLLRPRQLAALLRLGSAHALAKKSLSRCAIALKKLNNA